MQWHVEDQWLSYDFAFSTAIGQVCPAGTTSRTLRTARSPSVVEHVVDGVARTEGATTYTQQIASFSLIADCGHGGRGHE